MDNEVITTKSIARGIVDIEEEFILEETPRTRTVFKAQIHDRGIRGDIYRYKKDNHGNCNELISADFRQLNENEGVKITLSTEAINILNQNFTKLKQLLDEQGVRYGENNFTIIDEDAFIITDRNKAGIFTQLLENDSGEEFWMQMVNNSPDLATRLASLQLQNNRALALSQFEEMLNDENSSESDWQNFFQENTWIFGYGLRYQILKVIQFQPNYGGTIVTGRGGQRGDFLTATEAETKFTCLVEIKKSSTPLLQASEYRNGAWGISNELSGAITQIQTNCAKWEIEGSRVDQNRDQMGDIATISPKGIVVIGNTAQLENRDKRNSFERYRSEIRNPEIITYDELFERANFIVGAIEQEDEGDDNVPL
jgi:hypothetical protein